MPVYILRHEQRNLQNPRFESPLTAQGMCNAVKLVDTLRSLQIDTIYASPFLRVIQTIYPYCKATQQKVCIEHSLYESMDNRVFTTHNSSYTWCDLPPRYHHIIHRSYSSVCTNVELYETFEDVCERVRPFVDELIQKCANTSRNVLLVAHLTTAKAIQHVIDKSVRYDNLAMGGIVQLL